MGFLFGKKQSINTSQTAVGAINIQNSAQGLTIPVVYGANRITGNNIWYGDFVAIPHTETTSTGGKGGGGSSVSNTTYTYTVGLAVALCHGPIIGVGNIWEQKNITSEATLGLTRFSGSTTQTAWSYLTTNHPADAFGYRGIAYEATSAYNLGGSTGLPNLSFEVQGFLYTDECNQDTTPKEVLKDLLPNTDYGVSFPAAQLDAWTDFYTYCRAAGIAVSPIFVAQRAAADIVTELAQIGNTAPVWSEGVLKMVPYADQAITGGGSIFSSPTYNISMTTENIVDAANWHDVRYSGTSWSAVSFTGAVVRTSSDGVTWNSGTMSLPGGAQIHRMHYTPSGFLAGGYDGGFHFIERHSVDGSTWSAPTSLNGVSPPDWPAIVGGYWSALPDSFTLIGSPSATSTGQHLATSVNGGVDWTTSNASASGLPVGIWIKSVAGPVGTVIVDDGSNKTALYTGGSFTTGTLPFAAVPNALGAGTGAGIVLAAAVGTTSTDYAISADGVTWTAQSFPSVRDWRAATFDGELWLALGYAGTTRLYTSPSGLTGSWTDQGDLPAPLTSVFPTGISSNGTGRTVVVFSGSATCLVIDRTHTPGTCTPGADTTFTPNTTVNYQLTDDDFLAPPGEPPVLIKRKRPADAYNQVLIQCRDRTNNYNNYVADATDQAAIDLYGLRPMPMLSFDAICQTGIARQVAQTILTRALYYLNTYEFTVGWKYARLEPMDLVGLTDSGLGLNQATVRILSVEEDEDGQLKMTAEDFKPGTSNAGNYSTQATTGYVTNYDVDPGNSATPVIFQPPLALTTTPVATLGTAGGANWGGCEVWLSSDGTTYTKYGTITAPAKMGVLTANLPIGAADPDVGNTLSVDLTASLGALVTVPTSQADAEATLSYVDGELLAYANVSLTSAYHYDITYLRRGRDWTVNAAHLSGTKFMRLDKAVFSVPVNASWVGTTIYVKLPAFNIYGGALQSLASVAATGYVVQPTGLTVIGGAVPTDVPAGTVLYVASGTLLPVTGGEMTIEGDLTIYGEVTI